MKFYFEIPDKDFGEEFGINFVERVQREAIKQVANDLVNGETGFNYYSAVSKKVDEILKNNQNDIVNMVIERVSDKIMQKKTILNITPKASEIAELDKSNEKYFLDLIDKAIAKRFK